MSLLKTFVPALALISSLGCMKDPELKPDFGPEITPEDYAKAMSQVEVPDPYTIKKGEFAYLTTETFLEGRPFNLDRRWAYTVTNKEDDAANNEWIFTYFHELREYVGGQEKVSTSTSTARLEKKVSAVNATSGPSAHFSPPASLMAANKGITFSEVRPLESLTRVQTKAAEKEKTYHNLKFQKGFFPTPEFVQSRPDCGRKDPLKCKDPLKASVLSYDVVDWKENQKFHVEWVISPEIPYFGSTQLDLKDARDSFPGVLRSCVSTSLPVQGQRVRITQCDELKDFTFGHE